MPRENDRDAPGLVNPAPGADDVNPGGAVPVVTAVPDEEHRGAPRDAGGAAPRPGDQRHGMAEDDVHPGEE
jgi:hypothetical protein